MFESLQIAIIRLFLLCFRLCVCIICVGILQKELCSTVLLYSGIDSEISYDRSFHFSLTGVLYCSVLTLVAVRTSSKCSNPKEIMPL